MMYFNQLF